MDRDLKICVCATVPFVIRAFYGGQLRFLQENGFEVTILTSPDEQFASELPPGVRYCPVEIARRVRPWADLGALWAIWRVMRANRFDLVQVSTPKAALLCSLAARAAGVPTRLYLMWGLYYTGQTGWRRRFFRLFERLICVLSTHIAPDGRETMAFAVAEGLCRPEKIEVVGSGSSNGIDLKRFDPHRLHIERARLRHELGIREDALVIGTVARLCREKGVNELVRGFLLAHQEDARLRLLVVGPMEGNAGLESDVSREIAVNPDIISLGFRSDVERCLAAMDIFVLPSWREGFPVASLEAGAMRLPVISTDVMGPRESVLNGQTGILVPVRDAEGLRAAIMTLARDPALRQQMGDAGRYRVETDFEQRQHWQRVVDHRRRILSHAEPAP